MNDHICNVHDLVLSVGGSGDVGKPEKFFDGGKYGRDQVLRMVRHLLEDFIALEEFMWNQLTLFFLEASENVIHSVVDGFFCEIVDIREIRSLTVAAFFCMRDCLNIVTLRKRLTYLVCEILMFELAWVVLTSGMMSGPG